MDTFELFIQVEEFEDEFVPDEVWEEFFAE